jgi:uncharacterized phage protein gp47/JayE
MYENKTFETILSTMLDRLPSNLDIREGSLLYNALAPTAFELAQAYFLMDSFLKLPFIDTSEGDFLTRICAQYGVERRPAAAAVKTGTFFDSASNPLEVGIGTRFGINGIVYNAAKRISPGIYEMTCEKTGSLGNTPRGELLPIDNIAGLARAELSEATLVPGSDEESDAALRQRTLNKIQSPSTSGSVNDYRQWALSIPGMGAVKVFPLWNGNGTVKVVLIDAEKKAASHTLVQQAADYIERVRPIGATVTVEAASNKAMDVSVSVILADGYTLSHVTEAVAEKIREYLRSIAFGQAVVSYARLGNAILEAEGVIDYSQLTLNEGTSNVELSYTAASCETPVLRMVRVQ